VITKNEEDELPVPLEWRTTFCEMVKSLVAGDYSFCNPIPMVLAVPKSTSEHIESYISDYGEELVLLPEETWDSSIYIWQDGYWDVLVDLWTKAEGRSDLVLKARVIESNNSFEFSIEMVYVP
jgi:hypothetical protein